MKKLSAGLGILLTIVAAVNLLPDFVRYMKMHAMKG
jgi:hypothetical protein